MDEQRFMPFDGIINFRDAGGYRIGSDARLRTGALYRCAMLADVSEADKAKLDRLGISAVCDLRDPPEFNREPTRWRPDHVEWLTAENDHQQPAGARLFDDDPETVRAFITNYYRSLPDILAPNMTGLIAHLAARNGPVLLHCAMGKDRTGTIVAILQDFLGVDRADIAADYVLSDRAFHGAIHSEGESFDSWPGLTTNVDKMKTIARDRRVLLMVSKADYILAALDQIDRDHGSTEAYLRKRAGADDAMLATIRDKLIER